MEEVANDSEEKNLKATFNICRFLCDFQFTE